MKRKIVWLLISCLIAASMLTVSCRPTEEEEIIITEEKEEKEPAHEEFFSVGETAESDKLAVAVTQKLAVTVTEMELIDSYDYYRVMDERWDVSEAPAGSTYIIVNVKIKNLSSTDTIKVGTLRMRGGWADGDVPTTYYMGEGPLDTGWPLPPGEEIEGKAKFTVPKASTNYYVKFRFSEEPEVWAVWTIE